MDTDRNLLFGCWRCTPTSSTPHGSRGLLGLGGAEGHPLAELLVQRGWLTAEDRADVEKLFERKLRKHSGDAKASLAEVTTDQIRQSLTDDVGFATPPHPRPRPPRRAPPSTGPDARALHD